MTNRRVVPYNTGKLLIGCAHMPRPAPLTADQERLQASLLDQRTARPLTRMQRLLGAVLRWL